MTHCYQIPRETGTPGPSRRAFTLVEVLVASAILVIFIALLAGIWSGTRRSFFKGDDALTSAQEASLVMLHLRRDLLGISFRDPIEPYDLRYQRAGAQGHPSCDLKFDRGTGALRRTAPSGGDAPKLPAKGWALTFFVSRGLGGPKRITYVYDAGVACLRRRVDGGSEQSLAEGRLAQCSVEPWCRPSDDSARVCVFDPSFESAKPIGRIWFRVTLEAASSPRGLPMDATKVRLNTRIFPKHVNQGLRALWYDEK